MTGRKQTQEVALAIDTYNSTSFKSLKRHLETIPSNVVLAQETHIVQSGVPEASQWASRRGWHSLWAPSLPGKARHTSSGGIAIFVRSRFGLHDTLHHRGRTDDSPCALVEGRLVRGFIDIPGYPQIAVYSVYLHVGLGLDQLNFDILSAIGGDVEMHGAPYVIAGDFNMSLQVLGTSGFAEKVRGQLVFSQQSQGTCRGSSGKTSLIDFFVVDSNLQRGISGVAFDEHSTMNPHRPVTMTFHPRISRFRALEFRLPEPLPKEAPFGLRPCGEDWQSVIASATVALEAARHLPRQQAMQAIGTAYAFWACLAEVDIAKATGAEISSPGLRAAPARLELKPVVPKPKLPQGLDSDLRAHRWLFDRVMEIRSLWNSGPDEACRRLDQVQLILDRNCPEFVRAIEPPQLAVIRQAASEVAQCKRSSDVPPEQLDEVSDLVERAHLEAEHALQQEQRAEAAASSKRWREWAVTSLDGAASAAYRFTRGPQAWCPTTTLVEGTIVTADPLGLLAAQKGLWKGAWAASECDSDDIQRLP